jgi:phosphoglycolate phosphatase
MKKRYKAIIFDMDGTLADTSQGIYECHRYAAAQMGLPILSDSRLMGIIGEPLFDTYRTRFGLSEKDARLAVSHYRSKYVEKGVNQAKPYEGIKRLLEELDNAGYLLAIASLKAERFVFELIKQHKLLEYFDVIKGMDEKDKSSKADLIRQCLILLNVKPNDAILIGDSEHDARGAHEIGLDFLAVTYGFGYKDEAEAQIDRPIYIASGIEDICTFFGLER